MLSDILTSGANGLLIPKVLKRLHSLIVRMDILHCNMKKKDMSYRAYEKKICPT